MPFRNYECKRCGHLFEYFIVRSDDRPFCEKCDAKEEELEQKPSTNVTGVIKGFSAKNRYGLKPGGD